jgi:predicted outer membrane repeat protein
MWLLLAATVHAAGQTGPGYALSFDGVSGFVKIGGFLNNAPMTEVTVEFWQNVSQVRAQATFYPGGAPGGPPPGSSFSAFVPAGDGQVYWDFGNITAGGRLSYFPTVALPNSWQHFALVASLSGNYMAIYRNGVLEASKQGMTPLLPANLDLDLSGARSGLPFGGMLDEFRIWNVARTQDQILQNLYHSLTGNEPGLVAYWRFSEGHGNVTQDATGSAINAGSLSSGVSWVHSKAPFVPDLAALAPTALSGGGVRLNARVNPDSLPTTAWFQWGTNTNFGNSTPPTDLGNGAAPFLLMATLTGAASSQKYYYGPVAMNQGGTLYGGVEFFVILPPDNVTNNVTNLYDSGTFSLRDMISTAAPNSQLTIPSNLLGVIHLTSPLPTSPNLTILGNCKVVIDGGGTNQAFVPITDALTLSGVALSNCFGGNGGAISVSAFGTFMATNCTFTANRATGRGGAISVGTFGTLVLNNCTLAGNQAANGGALNTYGNATLNSCTVASNTASSTGGGLLLESGFFSSLAVVSCTVAGNSAVSGGGIEDDEGSLSMQNSIIADNTLSGGSGPDVRNSVPGFSSSGYNLISRDDGSSGWRQNGLPDDDQRGTSGGPFEPVLARLDDNCGCTRTMQLLPGSPAIDTGSSGGFSTDQRGLTRPQNVLGGGSPPDDYSDIGAFEVQPGELIAPPTLTILPAGTNVILLWGAKAKAYTLEHSLSLKPTAWLVVPQTPALTNSSTQLTVTRSASATNDFYRLRAP